LEVSISFLTIDEVLLVLNSILSDYLFLVPFNFGEAFVVGAYQRIVFILVMYGAVIMAVCEPGSGALKSNISDSRPTVLVADVPVSLKVQGSGADVVMFDKDLSDACRKRWWLEVSEDQVFRVRSSEEPIRVQSEGGVNYLSVKGKGTRVVVNGVDISRTVGDGCAEIPILFVPIGTHLVIRNSSVEESGVDPQSVVIESSKGVVSVGSTASLTGWIAGSAYLKGSGGNINLTLRDQARADLAGEGASVSVAVSGQGSVNLRGEWDAVRLDATGRSISILNSQCKSLVINLKDVAMCSVMGSLPENFEKTVEPSAKLVVLP